MLPRMMVDDLASVFESAGLLRQIGDDAFRVVAGARSIAASPDGARYACVGASALTLLDADSGAPLRRVAFDERERHDHLCFASDGVLLFTAGWGPHLHVYDARSLALVRVIETGFRNTMVVSSCPAAAHLLYTGGFDHHSVLRDMRTGRTVFELPFWEHGPEERGSYVHDAVFSPDGSKLLTLTYQGADLWDVASGEHVARIGDSEFCPAGAAFSPDGEDLFVGNNRGKMALVNPRSGAMEFERQALPVQSSVHKMVVTPDGDSLACCAENGSIYVLHPSTFKVQRAITIGSALGTSGALLPDGDTFAVVDDHGAIVRCSLSEGTIDRPPPGGPAIALAFADDDTLVAAARSGAVIRASISTPAVRVAQFNPCWHCDLSPSGSRLVLPSASGDRTMLVIDTNTLLPISSLPLSTTVAINDDGLIVTAAERGVLVGESKERVEAPSVRVGVPLFFSRDGGTVLCRNNAELCRIDVRARAARDVAKVSRGEGVCTDRRGRAVIGAGAKVILLGDAEDGAEAESFAFKGMNVCSVACSADGSVIAAGTHSGWLLLMKRGDPKSAVSARVAIGSAQVRVSPDGTRLAVSGVDPKLRVYDVAALFDAKAAPGKDKDKGKSKARSSDDTEAAPRASAKKAATKAAAKPASRTAKKSAGDEAAPVDAPAKKSAAKKKGTTPS